MLIASFSDSLRPGDWGLGILGDNHSQVVTTPNRNYVLECFSGTSV